MKVQNWLDQFFDQADTQLVEHFKISGEKLKKLIQSIKLG